MRKQTEEWLQQAQYDYDTAKIMRQSKRNVYAVLMCHMAVEKALKGLLFEVTEEIPPKTHSLIFLLNKAGKKPKADLGKFIIQLNDASVATRYPEELNKLILTYTDKLTDSIIKITGETIAWIKQEL